MTRRADEAVERDSSGQVVLSVGPQDVDSAAAVTKDLGVHNKAHRLLQRHAQMYPAALRTALSRPLDGERSMFLREHEDLVDAVAEAAGSIKGRRKFFPDGAVVESADVRGTGPDRIFAILFRTPPPPDGSGRSARGVINYSAVPAVERAFAEHREAAADASRPAPAPADPESADDALAAEEAARETEERLQALEKQLQDLSAEKAELQEQLDAGTEPFEGYDDLNAQDAIQRVKQGGYLEFGKQGLEAIVAYEEAQEKPRKTVIEAAQEELDAIPADGETGGDGD